MRYRDQYLEEILTHLAEGYRKSRKDSGTSLIHRRTIVKPEKLYRKYRENDGDPSEIEALNEAAEMCRTLGFADYQMKRFSNEIEGIWLEDAKIEAVESYLKTHCGYQPKADKMQEVRDMIRRYKGRSPAADLVCGELCGKISCNQVPARYEQTEDILRALVFIENNTMPLYLREASQMIYGSTKYFEEKTLDAVCRRLRNFLNRPCGQDEMPGEILKEYHIYPEQQRFCLKGDAVLKKGGCEIPLGAFPGGIEFSADELNDLREIRVNAERFITVENKTAYYRCTGKDSVYFYLGGYTNRTQRDFLKKVKDDNPDLKFLHFGDIDAGGFYIHDHLCRMTGVPFGLWHMSAEELKDSRYEGCLQKLTPGDRKRLKSLRETELYRETAEYMLRENVKLEQEIVSLYLKSGPAEWTIQNDRGAVT